MFSKEIKKILLIVAIFSNTSLYALVDHPDGLHGFHNYMCYQEDDRIPASMRWFQPQWAKPYWCLRRQYNCHVHRRLLQTPERSQDTAPSNPADNPS